MPIEELEQKKKDFFKKITLTSKQIQSLERSTIGQSSCDEWRIQRKIRLTSSNFGKVAKLRESTSRGNTVKYILYELFRGNTATRLLLL